MPYVILKHFSYEHLPPHLAEISKPFHDLAHKIGNACPDNVEIIFCLRKLLEAKDCAVRAMIP